MVALKEDPGIVLNVLADLPAEDKFIPKKERKKKRCEQP